MKQLLVSEMWVEKETLESNLQLKHLAIQQLNFKDESGIWWDDGWVTICTIRIVRRAGQLGHLADAHLWRR